MSFDATPPKCIPPPLQVNWSGYDFNLWPENLFSNAHSYDEYWWLEIPLLSTEILHHTKQVLTHNRWMYNWWLDSGQ